MSDLHVTHSLHGVKLGPKLGPFPAAVWVVIVAGGLYVAHRRAQSGAGATTPADATAAGTDATSATDAASTDSGVPFGVSTDTPAQYDTTGDTFADTTGDAGAGSFDGAPISSSAPVVVQDNVTWQSAAISALVHAGITPVTANNAIVKYLAGAQLTTDEAHALNVAIGLVGPPPEGAPAVSVEPAPRAPHPTVSPAPRPTTHPKASAPRPTKPAPKPVATAPRPTHGQRVTVHAGDTLTAIASAHHVSEPALYAANKTTIERAAKSHGRTSSDAGHWIFAGTVLVLP